MFKRKILPFISILISILFIQSCSTVKDFSAHPIAATKSIFVAKVGKSEGHYKVGSPYKIKGKRYVPKERFRYTEKGIASWYGPGFHGKKTANGEIFDENGFTAAHRTLQLPSLAKVTNLGNNRSVIVRINDRGPYAHKRVIDLSKRAAKELGFIKQGTARVKIEILTAESMALADASKARRNTLGVENMLNSGNRNSMMAKLSPIQEKEPIEVAKVKYLDKEPLSLIARNSPPKMKPVVMEDIIPPDDIIVTKNMAKAGSNLYVQAGSYETIESAKTIQNQVYHFGRSDIRPVTIYGKRYYNVRVGPLQSQIEANRVHSEIVALGNNDARVIVQH